MKKTFDKFGHFRGYSTKAGPPGVGFVLDADGNYNMQNKNLTNLKEPRVNSDAATKAYVVYRTRHTMTYDGDKKSYTCNARLSEVKPPEKDGDAVNLSYLKEKTLYANEGGDYFDAKKKRLCNLGESKEDGDGVTRKEITDLFEMLGQTVIHVNPRTSQFDCAGLRLGGLGDAQDDLDSVSLSLVKSLLKAQAYLVRREITDASIHLRREIHNLHKKKYKPADIETHLNSVEHSFKRSWREALQNESAEKRSYSVQDKHQISSHAGILEGHLDLYLDN